MSLVPTEQAPTTMSALLESVDCMPVWVEICVMFVFILGFVAFRSSRRPQSKKGYGIKKYNTSEDVQDMLRKSIEKEVAAGNHERVLSLWRAVRTDMPTQLDTLCHVVSAFIIEDPKHLVDEIAEHLATHPCELRNVGVVASVLEAVGRSGNTSVMEETKEGLLDRLDLHPSAQISEALIAGYAFGGTPQQLEACMDRIKAGGQRITVRCHALALKGLVNSGELDAAMMRTRQMKNQAILVPSFGITEICRLACDSNRAVEIFEFLQETGLKMTADAVSILLEHSTANQHIDLTRRIEKLARETKVPFGLRAYDSLLKVYVTNCDPHALELLQETQPLGINLSEGLCVGLLARSAEAKFLTFADAIVTYARQRYRMTVTIYSALMKVYAYSGLYDKACDLYTEIIEQGIEPDQLMYSCFMKFAAECGRTEFLQDLSNKVPSLDLQNAMSLIRAAMKTKDVGSALGVIERMKSAGLVPDLPMYNAVLNVCAVAGDPKSAEHLLVEMKSEGKTDLTTYNTALKAHTTVSDTVGARNLLADMEEAGFPPNDVSYNCLINMSVQANKLHEAWETVDRMQRVGVPADCYTLATMMKVARRVDCASDLNRALALLDSSGIDVCQDEVLLNTVVEACTRHRNFKRLDSLLAAFGKSKLQPAAHTYAALIRACGVLHDMSHAWKLWNALIERLPPTEIALGCMLDALVNNNHVDAALDLFRKWKNTVGGNIVIYSTLLKGLANAQRPVQAMDLVCEMRAAGLSMCTKVYNYLIDAHIRLGCMEEVSALLEMMGTDGCQPDDFTRSLLIKGYCLKGDFEKAFEVFRSASRDSKVTVDVGVFNSLLDGCIQHNRTALADQLLEQMECLGVAPTNFTLAIVVKMWGRRCQLDRAFEVVETWTKQKGLEPSSQVLTSLMAACLKNSDAKRALGIFQRLRIQSATTDARAFTTIIGGCLRLGHADAAIRLAEEAYGLPPNQRRGMDARQDLEAHVKSQLSRALKKRGAPSQDLLARLHGPESTDPRAEEKRGSGRCSKLSRWPKP